jgi:hypothetical protein
MIEIRDRESSEMSDRERLAAGVEATATGRPAAGETQGLGETFDAPAVARAFDVAPERVHNALRGEYGLGPDARVDSKQAQNLAEVLLGDQPLDQREAALMKLGGFTPRPDDIWGLGDKAPGEQGERLSDRTRTIDGESTSPRSSYDPATNPADPAER